MSSFENLPQAIDQSAAMAPPTPEEIAFAKEKLLEEKALGIVLQDVSTAEKFLQSKALPQAWDTADELFRAKVTQKKWPGTDVKRSSLSMPVVMEVIETILPQIHLAFFSDKQPFLLDPVGKTAPEAARAEAKLLKWKVKKSGFKEETRKIAKSCLQYGVGIGKWGWKSGTDTYRKYTRDESGAVVSMPTKRDYSCPTFEWVDLRNLLVDPSLRSHDIRDARYVVHQKFITADDLDELRNDPTYKNVPTRAQLKTILAERAAATQDSLAGAKQESHRQSQAERAHLETSADPTKTPLELLEYWSEDRVIVVLQRCIVIRNEENEFGRVPFLSCAFIDVLGAFHGFGISKLLEGDQIFQAGVANAWTDSLTLYLTPAWHRKNGIGPKTQTIAIAPGVVVNDNGELSPLQKESVSFEAITAIKESEARARRRVGANFGANMPNQALRTAEGVQEFTSDLQVRLQYFVDNFAELVFMPALEAFIEIGKENLSPKQINEILTEEEGKAYQSDILEVYNGQYKVDVLTSTKMAARRAMMAMIPMWVQLFSAEPVQESLALQGKKVNYAELITQTIDLAGWKSDSIIVDMTDEDKQRLMLQNQAAVRALAETEKLETQHQNNLELEAAKGDARAGVQVIRHALKESEEKKPEQPLATRKPE